MPHSDSAVTFLPLSGRVMNRNAKGGTPGTRFVRRSGEAKSVKMASRMRVLDLFDRNVFVDQLRILTFPSTNWIFEGMLINNRAGTTRVRHIQRVPVGLHTMIVGIEREESIYRTALNLIPSVRYGFRTKECPPYATSSLRTFSIKRFLRCEFEGLAESEVSVDCKGMVFNGAWLDFNGCISMRRKNAIEKFLLNHTNGNCRLVVTAANCRYNSESEEYWGSDKFGSILSWCGSMGEVLYSAYYKSSVPMIEFAIDCR